MPTCSAHVAVRRHMRYVCRRCGVLVKVCSCTERPDGVNQYCTQCRGTGWVEIKDEKATTTNN